MASDSEKPFRLADESDEDRAAEAERVARAAEAAIQSADEVEGIDRVSAPAQGRGEGVDTRTVAEKVGKAVQVVSGERPPPEGWPLEALAFPLRRPGPILVVGGAFAWVLLDLVTLVPAVAFLGYLLKLLVLPFFVRWQLHEAGMTAAGRDQPTGWLNAMELDREQVVGLGRWFLAAFVLTAPGFVALHFSRTVAGLALLFVASLWLAVGALGLTVGERGFLWPWRAIAWIGRRPLALAVATLGWWAAAFSELAVSALSGAEMGVAILACIALRLVFVYLWLVSARALGVVGRSWTPWGDARGE